MCIAQQQWFDLEVSDYFNSKHAVFLWSVFPDQSEVEKTV